MKKGLTELVFILDRSGSMSGLEADTIGGFNAMIERQKKEEGEALVSTVLFSDKSAVIHDRAELKNIKPLTEKEYSVGGCTALLDAIGGAVKHIASARKYAREQDVPEHTLFVITTDGMENASRFYSYNAVRRLIEDKKESGWEFLFLGANIDAAQTAEDFGLSSDMAADYDCDEEGTRLNFDVVSEAVSSVRASKTLTGAWKRRIEEAREKRKK